MPFLVDCECKQGSSEGDVEFVMENQVVAMAIIAIRWVCLLALYAGFTAVIYSVFVIEHPTDVSLTPPFSSTCAFGSRLQHNSSWVLHPSGTKPLPSLML